ncbi:NnrT protein [Amaricoccus sp.]|uniref:NnrT protein n=1 Tax=Amaricoccus sp. TaxID=1872485 RepID=UPI001B76BF56|nr:NnrT protein [Amaricoccus sp.]MBP7002983.1 NnrT protein [Amaricoccus sp.]
MAGQPPVSPGWRLVAAVYPFAAGAAAVNLFFLSLILSWVGAPVLTPWLSVLGGVILGVPAAVAFARHLRRLMAKADGGAE